MHTLVIFLQPFTCLTDIDSDTSNALSVILLVKATIQDQGKIKINHIDDIKSLKRAILKRIDDQFKLTYNS